MEISHFSVDHASQMLTIYMEGMPLRGDIQTTQISAGGHHIGYIRMSAGDQTILSSVAGVTRSGKIMVVMELVDGNLLQAWSSEEYVTNSDDHGAQPVVNGAIPQEAAPGDMVTLRGIRLKQVSRVALGPRTIPNSGSAQSDTSMRIRIPDMSPGTYSVILWGKLSGSGGGRT